MAHKVSLLCTPKVSCCMVAPRTSCNAMVTPRFSCCATVTQRVLVVEWSHRESMLCNGYTKNGTSRVSCCTRSRHESSLCSGHTESPCCAWSHQESSLCGVHRESLLCMVTQKWSHHELLRNGHTMSLLLRNRRESLVAQWLQKEPLLQWYHQYWSHQYSLVAPWHTK